MYSARQANHIREFGYLRTLDFFVPHITLDETNEATRLSKIRTLKKALLSLIGSRITVDRYILGLYFWNKHRQHFVKRLTKKLF